MAESRSTKTRPSANGAGAKRQRGGRSGVPVYSPAVAREICDRLAAGESLCAICNEPRMPTETAVRRWVADDRAGFRLEYARVREIGYQRLADQIIALSDNRRYESRPDIASAIVAQQRLAVDTRKWLLSKVLPKIYGDRIEVTGDPDAPVVTRIELVPVAPRMIDASPAAIEHDDAKSSDE